MKTLDPVMESILNSEHVPWSVAVYIDMDGTPAGEVRVHSGSGTYQINSQDYIGLGGLGSIEAITKTGSTSPEGVRLALAGLDPILLSDVQLEKYQGRSVIVYFCIFANDYQTIHTHIAFEGRLDTMNISYGKTASVELTAEDRLVDWQRGDTNRWNQASHNRTLPAGVTDKFFQYVEETVDKDIQFDPYIQV